MNVTPGFDLDSLTTCVVLIDEHGIVDALNQAAQVLLETSALEPGLPFDELASPTARRLFIGQKHLQM